MNYRFSYVLLLGCLLALAPLTLATAMGDDDAPATAQKEAEQKEAADESAPLVERVKANPDDVKLLNEYFGAEFRKIVSQVSQDPDAAEAALKQIEEVVEGLEPTEAQAKTLMTRATATINYFRQQLELSRTSLEEIIAKLKEDPSDQKALGLFSQKTMADIAPIARTDPETAEKKVTEARALLAELKEATDDDAVKQRLDQAVASLAGLDRAISSAKKLLELVGKDAAPLKVEAWVNGEPLSEGDLKGKVVLLDFWAVWCGPCIATFPHLREWQEKYADKGLVIVGLTKYYSYGWDEDANRAARKADVTPEEEQKMLERFAKEHDLHHRFAIQEGNELSEYYAVSGIPHVVVIDQEGKVRMIRVGSGEANANAISELLAELLKS